MSLFQKKPSVETSAPFYTLGLETTLLIVGLGNPGKKYEDTRHNIGFKIIDNFAGKQGFPDWILKKDLKCLLTNHKLGEAKVTLIKPTTYMNNSGEAVQAAKRFYRIKDDNVLVVHDELDIDFGTIRIRSGGKAAGHNGIKSVINHCGEDFGRVRVGIGPKKPARIASEDFVLSRFSETQRANLSLLLQEANSILSEYAFGGGELLAETRNFIV
ncbi:MAG TPA: aminoacyl-tRNA hydrolase [Candidatus Saccharimonadales bacterium]|nr:aminoacyl-tRNA hydrolase [Candidatus Saccharimonadales bacterium]